MSISSDLFFELGFINAKCLVDEVGHGEKGHGTFAMLCALATELLLDLFTLLFVDVFVLFHLEEQVDGFLRSLILVRSLDRCGRDGRWHVLDANGTVATVHQWFRRRCGLNGLFVREFHRLLVALGVEMNVEFS